MPIARPATRLRQTHILTPPRHVSSFRPRLEVLPRQPQPTVSSEDGHGTLRVRQHGNKSLPLPPLLDPIRVAAKERYTARKLEVNPEEQQTDFQKQLAANPFAHALATPIRQCHLTRARLPSHFLHPFTASISDTPIPAATVAERTPPHRPITVSLLPRSRRELPPGSALPTSTYVLNTRGTMQHLGKKRHWANIAGQRMQDQYARRIGKKNGKNVDIGREWLWDKGMPDVVLGQLGKEVVTRFNVLLEDDFDSEFCVDWLAPITPETRLDERERFAAVLMPRARASVDVDGVDDIPEHVPVYPLQDMLVPEDFEIISTRLQFGKYAAWAVVRTLDRRTMPLQLALHRLAMYLDLCQQRGATSERQTADKLMK